MYVNQLTLDYGDRGRQGARAAFRRGLREGPDSEARADRVRRVNRPLTAGWPSIERAVDLVSGPALLRRVVLRKQSTVWSFTMPIACMKA